MMDEGCGMMDDGDDKNNKNPNEKYVRRTSNYLKKNRLFLSVYGGARKASEMVAKKALPSEHNQLEAPGKSDLILQLAL